MKTKILLVTLVVSLLAACGGGGGEGEVNSLGNATVQQATFPIDTAIKSLVTNGYATSVTLSGKIGEFAVSGSGTSSSAAATATQFEGQPAFDILDNVTLNATFNGTSDVMSSVSHQFFSHAYAPLGQLDDDGTYYVVTSFSGWPTAAKVGDSGVLSATTVYSDASKSSVTGKQTLNT